MTIRLAPGLALPDDAVTQTFAILARRGAGKTYTGCVITEDLVASGLRVCVIDPLGAWWGLRSSADGKSDGLPVTILGGDHGDVPLEETAGKVVADLVATTAGSFVLDLSHFESNAAQDRFATDFAERLYRAKAKNRTPLHLMVDEADSFAPQRPQPGQQRMLGAFEAISRRGRIRGLGATLITQRPAVLNKNVLTQVECLIVMQVTAPQDRKAIEAWVVANDDRGQADTVLGSLASLGVGEAWVWSPQWLDTLERVKVRRRRTFDSSSTPEVGEMFEPARMAPVDLDVLRDQMAATIEKAKAEDPRELRRQIAGLRKELKAVQAATPDPVIQRVEVPVLDEGLVARLEEALAPVAGAVEVIQKATDGVAQRLADARQLRQPERPPGRTARRAEQRPRSVKPQVTRPQQVDTPVDNDVHLKAGARRMLEVLAGFHPGTMTRSQVATAVGMKKTGGTFGTYWSTLKRNGFLVEDGTQVSITDAGFDVIGATPDDTPMTSEEMLALWRPKLKAGARRMLDLLVDAYPDGFTRADLADAVDMEPSGGTFGTYLSTLRRNELAAEADGIVTASSDLFPDA